VAFGSVLVLVPLAAASGGVVRPAAPPRPGLSWSEADSLSRKLESIDRRSRQPAQARPQSVLVTQGELNSYLNLSLGPQMPAGITDLEVMLESERIHARAQLDLEKVRAQVPSGVGWGALSFLGGTVPIELRARLVARDGFGTVQVEDLRLATLPVPVAVLEQIVTSATRTSSNPSGFDILAPFRLPYAVKRVRIEPGRGFLDF
jgi:hypothetical protein